MGTGCGHFSLSSFLHQLPIKGAPPIYWTLMATLGTVQQIQANTAWNNNKPLWWSFLQFWWWWWWSLWRSPWNNARKSNGVSLGDGKMERRRRERRRHQSVAHLQLSLLLFSLVLTGQNYLRPQSFLKLTNHENIATSITFSRFSLSTSFSPSLNIKISRNTKYLFKSFHNNIAIGPTPSMTSSQDCKSFFAIKRIC